MAISYQRGMIKEWVFLLIAAGLLLCVVFLEVGMAGRARDLFVCLYKSRPPSFALHQNPSPKCSLASCNGAFNGDMNGDIKISSHVSSRGL